MPRKVCRQVLALRMSMSVKERIAKSDSEIGERQKNPESRLMWQRATGTKEIGMKVWGYGIHNVVPNNAESYLWS
jgi:hypothetical protein